ncbi:hypothetical protein N7468_010711 [Penicillium chermesinum]|uniref:Uncharacterized protein n=1 Tax=Penicillium chermesinum TaxID=63820 RepID=A0A9W9N896_9EURO|nr:uncharacterized protein N7468_010711 [Penicillium chermesinum]KAJ5215032.1 hypothetical protein N7468_010711 [Penicillium chermesinum]
MLVFKNMFSFVLTFYAYTWFTHGGVKRTMTIVGSIQVGICLEHSHMSSGNGIDHSSTAMIFSRSSVYVSLAVFFQYRSR